MMRRRNLLQLIGAGGAGLLAKRANAQHEHHAAPVGTGEPRGRRHAQGYMPVRTLNGWTLPYELKGGVKEFHLVAEEIEHEFAPGTRAKCWGYNGTTPGPTIEAVEGDRVRLFVTNRLPEATSVHWHGIDLPQGYDGVGGLTQAHIKPGETYVYEFTLRQHGTHMYHPHVDEMTQMAFGMMGMFIIHPRDGEAVRIDRDYCFLLHNWALHPGTYRPDPSILQDFDLWTFNSKVFPAIDPLVMAMGERIRIRIGNLSMWNHPIHLHSNPFWVTGSDGGRWPQALWRREATEIVGVGQVRDLEFVPTEPGDWALHCHMAHHTMNAMGHGIPNNVGVDQRGVAREIKQLLPGYMPMGKSGMSEHSMHVGHGMMTGPENTLPMMTGQGPYGAIEMGGMFTVLKVREGLAAGDFSDPGAYVVDESKRARRVSSDPDFGNPHRRSPYAGTTPNAPTGESDDHAQHHHHGSEAP